jgi:hypothetical protein
MDKKYYQKKILKYIKKMDGGTCRTCPKTGFHQHKGECWNDALTMLLLYSDEMSEHIQEIFDSGFNFDDCVRYAKIHSPKYLLPLNIEDADYDKYVKYSEEYLNSIYKRYKNESLPHPTTDIYTTNIPKITINRQPIHTTRKRSNSIDLSLSCVKKSYEIYNINNSKPVNYDIKKHGGTNINNLINISNFNYFLMNYYKTLKRPLNNFFINSYNFNIMSICENNNIEQIDFMKKLLNMYIFGITIVLVEHDFQNGNTITKDDSGHVQMFFSCGKKQYFYDDNGINDSNTNFENYITFIEFDWKDYLNKKIDFIKNEIKKNISNNKKDKDLYLSFSDFFNGHSTNNTIGRDYLKKYYIVEFSFISKEQIEQKTVNYKLYHNIMMYTTYTNDRTVELFYYTIDIYPNNINILEGIFNDNKNLFKKLLNKLFINHKKFNFHNRYINKKSIFYNILEINDLELADKFISLTPSKTYLEYAIIYNDLKLLELLLSKFNFDINEEIFGTTYLDTAIFHAENTKDYSIVEFIISDIKFNINRKIEFNKTYIDKAIETSNVKLLNLLLKRKDIDIDYKTNEETYLDKAIKTQNIDIIKIMVLDKRFYIQLKTKEEKYISYAIRNSNIKLLNLLLTKTDIESNSISDEIYKLVYLDKLIDITIETSNTYFFSNLIKNTDINKEVNDLSYLDKAIKTQNIDIINIILENKQFKIDRTKNNETYLDIAIKTSNDKIIELILAKTIDINRTYNGLNYLDKAINIKSKKLIELLLDRVDFFITDYSKYMNIAIETNNIELFNSLIKRKNKYNDTDININRSDSITKKTYLEKAIEKLSKNNEYDIIKTIILDDDFKINRIKDNKSYIDIAINNNDEKLLKLLLTNKKIDINLEIDNLSYLDKVINKNYNNMIKIILLDSNFNYKRLNNNNEDYLEYSIKKNNMFAITTILDNNKNIKKISYYIKYTTANNHNSDILELLENYI